MTSVSFISSLVFFCLRKILLNIRYVKMIKEKRHIFNGFFVILFFVFVDLSKKNLPESLSINFYWEKKIIVFTWILFRVDNWIRLWYTQNNGEKKSPFKMDKKSPFRMDNKSIQWIATYIVISKRTSDIWRQNLW